MNHSGRWCISYCEVFTVSTPPFPPLVYVYEWMTPRRSTCLMVGCKRVLGVRFPRARHSSRIFISLGQGIVCRLPPDGEVVPSCVPVVTVPSIPRDVNIVRGAGTTGYS
eukprot:376378-Prymnesium_polylepis.1